MYIMPHAIFKTIQRNKRFAVCIVVMIIATVAVVGRIINIAREDNTNILYLKYADLRGHNMFLSTNVSELSSLNPASTCVSSKTFISDENFFLKYNTSGMGMPDEDEGLLILSYRMKDRPHSGKVLTSVRDLVTGRSCTFTSDMSHYNNSDVVIIPARAAKIHKMPPYRPPGQRWVFYSMESFYYVKPPIFKYRFAFNHTMTYHKDSDIDSSIYGMIPQKTAMIDHMNVTKSKDKLVVWMSSHCDTQSNRDNFAHELSKHIKVDIYGNCGDLKCPKSKLCSEIMSQYKFYVAYENSMCNGYITEKPWKGLCFNTIPLVAGGGSHAYRSVLPPNSYIDLEKFKSAETVADYLKLLDSNDTLYQEYFAWRPHYKFGRYSKSDLSGRTCQYLHQTKSSGPHIVDFMSF